MAVGSKNVLILLALVLALVSCSHGKTHVKPMGPAQLGPAPWACPMGLVLWGWSQLGLILTGAGPDWGWSWQADSYWAGPNWGWSLLGLVPTWSGPYWGWSLLGLFPTGAGPYKGWSQLGLEPTRAGPYWRWSHGREQKKNIFAYNFLNNGLILINSISFESTWSPPSNGGMQSHVVPIAGPYLEPDPCRASPGSSPGPAPSGPGSGPPYEPPLWNLHD